MSSRDEKYPEDRGFTKRQIAEKVWYISGSRGCDTYLVIGEKKAAVIDTGENRRDLRAFVESITDLPLIVVNTHGHFDHAGSNGQFKDCPIYMSEFACQNCKTPHNYLNPEDYDMDYEPQSIGEGDVLDLGGRELEVIEVPCHSPGSLAYLDKKDRLLFTGDEVETGQVLIYGAFRKMCSVQRHYQNMQKLWDRAADYDYICPGHNGAPVYKTIITDYMEADKAVLDGAEGKKDISSASWLSLGDPRTPEDKARILSDPMNRRMEKGGASLVYSINHIFQSDEEAMDV